MEHVTGIPEGAYCKQVGKTEGGIPVSTFQLEKIVNSIKESLNLTRSNDVLDLCCGNGMISQAVAVKVNNLIGIDFTAPLIAVAQKDFQAPNIKRLQRRLSSP